ncbi:hypothetical protein C7B79_30380 [Chroococcidiopsis cubana CCALA 043]|nr:hypothetical protein C7B79_30380 [Chroococcidiopsis cubana CCALA 043]
MVEVTKKLLAAHSSINEEGAVCQSDLSPSADKQRECLIVAEVATSQSQALAVAAQSDAGKPNDVYSSRGGEQ